MAKPKRTFTGQEGQRSTGTAGPDAIRRDFDAAFAMFDPNAILPDGDAGGIGAENMKPGAATDEVIGDRTINDSTTPSGDTGKLTTLLSNLANRIRAIMGTSSWRSGPPTTLQAAKDHIDAPAPHSGHETPAGAQAKVDAHANRRDNPHQVTAAQVGAITSVAGISNPGGGVDIVAGSAISITKDTTNKRIVINAHAEGVAPGPHASTHASGGSDPITPAMIGAETPSGAQAKADAAKAAVQADLDSHKADGGAHGATSAATPNAIIRRDSAGRAKVAAPSASDDIARKAEVDAVLSALNTHKSSGDHDGRYYTKSQLDPIIRNLLLDRWTVVPSGTPFTLQGVAYGNGLWVAVGSPGAILTSTNGTSWTSRTSGTTSALQGVAYDNGLWVAVGFGGAILTSTNGTSWTSRTSGTLLDLMGVAYGNGLWVAVGQNGTILTSTNGTSWTSRTSGTTSDLMGVAYGNGLWVAVGLGGTILTSTNGTSWTSRTSGTSEHLFGVAYADGFWVVVGASGTILASPNGTSWTSRTSGTTSGLWGVAYADDFGVAVGVSGTILTSPDGTSWTSRASGTLSDLQGVAYGNDRWVAVGLGGTISTTRVIIS